MRQDRQAQRNAPRELAGAYILKGCRWLLHDVMRYPGEVVTGHIIHWQRGAGAAWSACGVRYCFTGKYSPHGTMPQFVRAEDGTPQIANTVIRHHVAVANMCPACRQELQALARGGLVVPYRLSSMHPETVERARVRAQAPEGGAA